MTPLELLAVGVIVVLVWMAGFLAGEGSHERSEFGFAPTVVLLVGAGQVIVALVWLLILGIKEAAK